MTQSEQEESIKRGLEDATEGRTHDLGSFLDIRPVSDKLKAKLKIKEDIKNKTVFKSVSIEDVLQTIEAGGRKLLTDEQIAYRNKLDDLLDDCGSVIAGWPGVTFDLEDNWIMNMADLEDGCSCTAGRIDSESFYSEVEKTASAFNQAAKETYGAEDTTDLNDDQLHSLRQRVKEILETQE